MTGSKIHRNKDGFVIIPRSIALKVIHASPREKLYRLPKKYVAAGVRIVMAEPHAYAWINALECGEEHSQATSVLCDGKGGFCCLGVEQDVNYGMVEVSADYDDAQSPQEYLDTLDYITYPTDEYLRYTNKMYFNERGVPTNNPVLNLQSLDVPDGFKEDSASELNDSRRLGFKEIAALLRNHMGVYIPFPQDLVRHDTK